MWIDQILSIHFIHWMHLCMQIADEPFVPPERAVCKGGATWELARCIGQPPNSSPIYSDQLFFSKASPFLALLNCGMSGIAKRRFKVNCTTEREGSGRAGTEVFVQTMCTVSWQSCVHVLLTLHFVHRQVCTYPYPLYISHSQMCAVHILHLLSTHSQPHVCVVGLQLCGHTTHVVRSQVCATVHCMCSEHYIWWVTVFWMASLQLCVQVHPTQDFVQSQILQSCVHVLLTLHASVLSDCQLFSPAFFCPFFCRCTCTAQNFRQLGEGNFVVFNSQR